ncbi:MAG: hypothetical protein ABJE66_00070 [Deltaproteobacteria bacterium]
MRTLGLSVIVLAAVAACRPSTALDRPAGGASPWLREGTSCMVCHDRLTTTAGEDVSFGTLWQASIMANSARDPYWQAAVRRETLDHVPATAAIEDECSRCHMPMANERARAAGRTGEVFANLPGHTEADPLAIDGVACSLCHQITPARFGERASFTGGFVIDSNTWPTIYGPYDVTTEKTSLMRSALGVKPVRGDHIRRSELCATCHTLYTKTRDARARTIGEFPEQVPYLEWLQSSYRETQSCQACHIPRIEAATPIASVAGTPRERPARHDFRGANFVVLGMLDRHRADLAVTAPGPTLEHARETTRDFLATASARVTIETSRDAHAVIATVDVENLTGHKLPTAYPSRRAWLHVTVRDADGHLRFESGKLNADGSIEGNDNDRDPLRFEPHHAEIRSGEDVQIYEAILGDQQGHVTTGLLSTTQYLKDNRLVPHGFPKTTATPDTAVHGEATGDVDFADGHDRVRYIADIGDARGPVAVEVEVLYQPIGYRWAHNLEAYKANEPKRFLGYYNEMASASSVRLAHAAVTAP